MPSFWIPVFAGFLPMVCWAVIVWWMDRYEKEPIPLLFLSFLWGVVPATLLSLLLEILFRTPSGMNAVNHNHWQSVLVDPTIEESVKFIGLLGIFWMAKTEIDGPLDGLIYAAIVGFGFSATETMIMLMSGGALSDSFAIIFLRSMIFGSSHGLFSSFAGIGLYFSGAFSRNRIHWGWIIIGFAASVGFHIAHNAGVILFQSPVVSFAMSGGSYLLGFLLVIGLFVGSLVRERTTIRTHLSVHVRDGMITNKDWELVSSLFQRLKQEWDALKRRDFFRYQQISKFSTLCAELAFKEKQLDILGDNGRLEKRIYHLRESIIRLSKSMNSA